MADNYLEKRAEKLRGGTTVYRRNTPSLDTLLLKNRSHRSYDQAYRVHMRQLTAIVSVNTRIPSGRNAQRLRFRLCDAASGGALIGESLRLGGSLPELHLPVPGTAPQAFIAICCTCEENPTVDIDLGISLQSMSLKAVELGLNAIIIRSFDRKLVTDVLGLASEPLALLAIGKGKDEIRLVEAGKDDDLKYYRRDGVHFVPKIRLEDLLL